jgi:hypothetical protein
VSDNPDDASRFVEQVRRNRAVAGVLDAWETLELSDAWLTAGCLFQTLWNLQAQRDPGDQIKDYDIFYFDADDLTADSERRVQAHVQDRLAHLRISVDIKNQARVHLWYPERFGSAYPALREAREGIDRFLVRETCVGLRPADAGSYDVHAPYGLAGIADGTLSPNPLTPHAALFDAKVASYRARWPWLRVAADGTIPA